MTPEVRNDTTLSFKVMQMMQEESDVPAVCKVQVFTTKKYTYAPYVCLG